MLKKNIAGSQRVYLYKLVVLVLLIIGLHGGNFTHASESGQDHTLVPLPTNIEFTSGTLAISSHVNVIGQDTADKDAIRILKEFLRDNNITINEQFDRLSPTIALGEEGSLATEVEDLDENLELPNISNLKTESYLLTVDSEANDISEAGTIVLKGIDGDGTFYAVKTLIQLAEQEDDSLVFKNLLITDESSMATRGIVEGFYGSPWSHSERLDQIKFYGDYKMNTYIYAPKDDPYHRSKWREPYPESEMERMEELINTAKENKVDFVFAISPGNDIRFDGQSGEDDFNALLLKSESLYEMGVRSFSILYDDIENKDGAKQAQLLNRFNEEFIKEKQDVKPLITVPTEYDTRAMGVIDDLSNYTEAFSQTLADDIKVMWTGQAIVSESLPLENFEFMQAVYGDQIGLWWNYPVSDYLTSKLALGPIVKIDKELEGKLDFFTMNPMEHANLSKITLATGADYAWNTAAYDADQSWEHSIELLYGELSAEMKTFANHSSRMADAWNVGREDAREIRESMDQLWLKLSTKKDPTEEVEILTEEFSNMVTATETLKDQLPPEILNESVASLNKLKLLGENGQLALNMVLAQVSDEDDQYNELKGELQANLSSLRSGARVSEQTVLAFIDEAIEYDPLPAASFDVSKTLVAPGEEVEFTSTSSLTAIDLEWTFEGAQVEKSKEENPVVVYEEEGIYTVKLVGKNALGEDEVIKENIITVTNLAETETIDLALGKYATASGSCALDEGPENAVDGSVRTKWCAIGFGNHTLTVDLGEINLVSEIVMKHAEAGQEPSNSNTSDYRVLISEDGESFTELVKVRNNKDGITKDQVPATKGRYVRLIIEKPTQGDDRAARIYGFEVMGLEGDVELPPTYEKPEEPETVETAAELKELVEQLAEEGKLDSTIAHSLTLHLTAVSRYEDQELAAKVTKHMEGFKLLIDYQKENELLSEKVYKSLQLNANSLIQKWQ